MLRWLWRVLVGRAEPAANPLPALPEPIEAQLATLRARLTAVETEWADTLDKITRWTARENARKRRSTARALEEGGETPSSGEIVVPEGNQDRKSAIRARVAQLHARG